MVGKKNGEREKKKQGGVGGGEGRELYETMFYEEENLLHLCAVFAVTLK